MKSKLAVVLLALAPAHSPRTPQPVWGKDGKADRARFFGVNADIPYLAGLAPELRNARWMYLNGVVLVSPAAPGLKRDAKYTMWQLDPSGKMKDRLRFEGHRGGHILYLRSQDLATANDDLRDFIRQATPAANAPAKCQAPGGGCGNRATPAFFSRTRGCTMTESLWGLFFYH